MIDRDIDIATPDGVMNTFVTRPDGDGPYPIVLFFMDAPGRREELHAMARRIGTVGYYVMLPNLYYRAVREFDATDDLDGRVDEMRRLIASAESRYLRDLFGPRVPPNRLESVVRRTSDARIGGGTLRADRDEMPNRTASYMARSQ